MSGGNDVAVRVCDCTECRAEKWTWQGESSCVAARGGQRQSDRLVLNAVNYEQHAPGNTSVATNHIARAASGMWQCGACRADDG